MIFLNFIIGSVISFFFLLFCIASLFEKEYRASLLSAVFLILNMLFWSMLSAFQALELIRGLNIAVIISFAIMGAISLIRYFPPMDPVNHESILQYDERDHMFSRNALKYNEELRERYYSLHPEKRKADEAIHAKKELGENGSVYYDKYYSQSFRAGFRFLSRLNKAYQGPQNAEVSDISVKELRNAIISIAKNYGAYDIGFLRLKQHHFYSHRGRHGDKWGEPIVPEHKFGIVIIIAMNIDSIKKAPGIETINESARSYVEAGKTAGVIAEYIRLFGFSAKEHTDANYDTILVPCASDAGLGEIGRMGLLMHPDLGPCLRISMVTTSLDLELDESIRRDESTAYFCKICRKCAINCPSKSISYENKPPVNRGTAHWSIDQEKCYSFWKSIGTDCGFCIRVCPYTKKNNLFHKFIRFFIRRNFINQHIALIMDDLFYGRKHKIK